MVSFYLINESLRFQVIPSSTLASASYKLVFSARHPVLPSSSSSVVRSGSLFRDVWPQLSCYDSTSSTVLSTYQALVASLRFFVGSSVNKTAFLLTIYVVASSILFGVLAYSIQSVHIVWLQIRAVNFSTSTRL